MSIGLFYSVATGRLRRIVKDDAVIFAELVNIHPVALGEGVIEAADLDPAEAQSLVNDETGKTPENDRFALVRSGFVEGVIIADDTIDSVAGRRLVATNTAKVGDRILSDDTFVRPDEEIDARIADLETHRARLLLLTPTVRITQAIIDAWISDVDAELAALETEKLRT